MSDILKINDSNFEETINKNNLVVVDFWAEWCGPCQMFASIFEDFAKDNKDVVCAKLNIDDSPKVAEKHNVLSIPTIMVFKNGKVVSQQTGAVPKSLIQSLVDEHK